MINKINSDFWLICVIGIYKVKQLYNYISKINSEWYNYWKGMSKEDHDFIAINNINNA